MKLAKADLVKKVGADIAAKTEMQLTAIKTTGEKGSRFDCAAELDSKYPTETRIPDAKLPITYVSEHLPEVGHTVRVRGL